MGQNRRYGSDISDEALVEMLIRPKPISLSQAEAGDPVTQAKGEAPEVQAWVRFPETAVRISGRAIAWTDKAVCVEFAFRDGARHTVWVWANAVTRKG